jgi:transposase
MRWRLRLILAATAKVALLCDFAGIFRPVPSGMEANICSRLLPKGTQVEKESLELLLAQGESIERIAKRFGKDPSTVSYWMKKYGLESPYAEKHAAKGGLERETLEALVAAGLSIAEIATRVGRCKGTVRHWLRRYGLRTSNGAGRPSRQRARAAKDAGQLTTTMTCRHHGETEFFLEPRGYYRCKLCRSAAVAKRRRKLKSILVAEAGGRCCLCGYDRHPSALEFHHVDPELKRMQISAGGIGYGLETLREEASKCILLCSNCHAEVENGLATLPLQLDTTTELPREPDPG